jgi:hypothetical protein
LRPPARRYLEELGKDALEPLREAAPLLANPELCKTYDFELHYRRCPRPLRADGHRAGGIDLGRQTTFLLPTAS